MDEPKTKRILSDRISSLPDSVIEHILACLPLREAAKTSVLSQAWKHKWVNRPTLAFNKSFWTRRFPYDSYTIDKLVSNVFKVICFHQGPLREFSLSNPYLRGYPAEVDQILLSLVGKCIQNLCIEIDGYKLSSRLFSFTKLQILRLSSCVFTSSHISFEQFTLLTHLHLMSVKFQNVDRVSLVIKCSLLQVFTLIHSGCSSSYDIDISIEAPNLNRLALVGSFRSLRVSHTPLLIDVSVHPIPSFLEHPNENQPNVTDFIKLLDDCRELKELATTIDLIGGFVMSNRQPQQVPLNVLRKLTLYEMCPSNPHDVRLLAALLHLPPCLQELVINMTGAKNLEEHEDLKHEANKLRRVKLEQLLGTKFEMRFIRWLLATSPELDKMTIEFSKKSVQADQIQCYKELNEFQRASNRAQIIFK